MINNELYEKFQNSLKTKKLICFGIGAAFWKFVNQYDGIPINMLIDNNKHGEKVRVKNTEYIIKKFNDIKQLKPEQVIILITVNGDNIQSALKEQLRSIGYFNIFCWSEIIQFNEPFYDNSNKYLLKYSANQIETNYKFKIAHIALHSGGNSGDIVLNYCVRQVFNRILGNIFFVMYPIHEQESSESISNFNNYDAIIIGGGGLFLPDTNTNTISGWQWACSNELMSKIEKPLIGFAIGYNYFNGQEPTDLFKNSLNYFAQKTKFIGIRNQRSLQIVKRILKEICKRGGNWITVKNIFIISLVRQLLLPNIWIYLLNMKIKI